MRYGRRRPFLELPCGQGRTHGHENKRNKVPIFHQASPCVESRVVARHAQPPEVAARPRALRTWTSTSRRLHEPCCSYLPRGWCRETPPPRPHCTHRGPVPEQLVNLSDGADGRVACLQARSRWRRDIAIGATGGLTFLCTITLRILQNSVMRLIFRARDMRGVGPALAI